MEVRDKKVLRLIGFSELVCHELSFDLGSPVHGLLSFLTFVLGLVGIIIILILIPLLALVVVLPIGEKVRMKQVLRYGTVRGSAITGCSCRCCYYYSSDCMGHYIKFKPCVRIVTYIDSNSFDSYLVVSIR